MSVPKEMLPTVIAAVLSRVGANADREELQQAYEAVVRQLPLVIQIDEEAPSQTLRATTGRLGI